MTGKREKAIIGTEKEGSKAKKKYRVLIQKRSTKDSTFESMTSFMVHDFKGMSTLKSIKKKLMEVFK